MTLFVDPNEPIDRRIVELSILAAAPERSDDLQDIWDKYGPNFFCVPDEIGITLKAGKERISFSPKTMSVIWLLGFAAWKVFVCHSPHLLWSQATGQAIDDKMLRNDEGLYEAAGAFKELLSISEDVVNAASLDDIEWPDDVPQQQCDSQGFDTEQKATFHIIMIATAYALLHEIRHVIFAQEGNRPAFADEEIACDEFARDFLLARLDEYARDSGYSEEKILMKRAMGIALGAFIVYEITPVHGMRGTSEYPPIADRLDALITEIDAPSGSSFWDFAGALLIATLRRWDRNVAVPSDTPAEMCRFLVDEIRKKVV